jgi:hypothetical protein
MKCSKGHTYRNGLPECPVCQEPSLVSTAFIPGSESGERTEVFHSFDEDDDNKTIVIPNKRNLLKINNQKNNLPSSGGGTMFGGELDSDTDNENGHVEEREELRMKRKLVGWLITYSIDPLGIDYKLYEGKNIIGHSIDCNITVNDRTMSGKHATILFRAGKYKIKDELSTHGTFVNDEDIEEETIELHDGDLIRMGQTVVFEFKAPASL